MGSDYVELESKEVRVRKPHCCTWCGESIPKHSQAISTSCVFDDRLQRDWMHRECTEARKRVDWSYYPDGFEFGVFVRGETKEQSGG